LFVSYKTAFIQSFIRFSVPGLLRRSFTPTSLPHRFSSTAMSSEIHPSKYPQARHDDSVVDVLHGQKVGN
jgi:hypothetical protein